LKTDVKIPRFGWALTGSGSLSAVYHTLILVPAASNTVAKYVYGICEHVRIGDEKASVAK
jgi:hypothetical protein